MNRKIPGNSRGGKPTRKSKHPGEIPKELYGGQYVRNGSNPIDASTVDEQEQNYHWFDGDGMLAGVYFQVATSKSTGLLNVTPMFTSRFILTDLALNSLQETNGQHTAKTSLWNRMLGRAIRNRGPLLPSMATLVNPEKGLLTIVLEILRSLALVLHNWVAKTKAKIARISVANTGIYFHDGRALATCESGVPIRVHLPGLRTVGWFDGYAVAGENAEDQERWHECRRSSDVERFGGTGPCSWIKEWTTGHPKFDPTTGEMILIHNTLFPPYVHVSVLVPEKYAAFSASSNLMNRPVPNCAGARMRHDFGASATHTVIVDVPLSLNPLAILRNKPIVEYTPREPARFGVFPRREPDRVKWLETDGCCIFHTANTWDDYDQDGNILAVNMLACRMNSASLVYTAGNIVPPTASITSGYRKDGPGKKGPSRKTDGPSQSCGNEQCRLYYYRFSLNSTPSEITHQFALSPIPFEFPTLNPSYEMFFAQFIYGCSTTSPSFTSALGKGTKIDVLVKVNAKRLLDQAKELQPSLDPDSCVDSRSMSQILASQASNDCIRAFRLPDKHYAQEARFVARQSPRSEDDGYLLFYVFDEGQLDEDGECSESATSELWILDAISMDNVVARVTLPTRVPYGLHGNWFDKEKITGQRRVRQFRRVEEHDLEGRDVDEATPLLSHSPGDDE